MDKSANRNKWIVIGTCFMLGFICLGFCSSNKGMYLGAITEALHIDRSLFSLSDSIRYCVSAVMNLFFGYFLKKLGKKLMIGCGVASLIISMLLNSVSTSVWGFYISGAFLGFGLTWCTTTMVSSIVHSWCKENAGTIMGFVLAGNGLGGALAAQIISPYIYDEVNPFGYRNAYKIVIILLVIIGVLAVLLIKDPPANGTEAPKPAGKKKKGRRWEGIPYQTAMQKNYFWFGAVCVFFTGLILQSITGISPTHMKDVNLEPGFIATCMSVHSVALAGFKFLMGAANDRFGIKVSFGLCNIAAVIAMLALALISTSLLGQVLTVIYSLLSSMALPLETIMIPLLVADLFGDESYDKILGIYMAVNTTGYALGAPLANLGFDLMGSYVPVLYVCAIVMAVVLFAIQYVIRSAHKDQGIA